MTGARGGGTAALARRADALDALEGFGRPLPRTAEALLQEIQSGDRVALERASLRLAALREQIDEVVRARGAMASVRAGQGPARFVNRRV